MTNGELQVFEYGGTARSGKGTIVSWLSEVHPEVAIEETGGDYRAVTYGLLQQDLLEQDMDDTAVAQVMSQLGISALTDLVARRNELEQQGGPDVLHTPEVDTVVHRVGAQKIVRKAVKGGFRKRVEAVRDDEEHSILLVDGRNLGPVVETIKGTDLVMRTFVYCNAVEAARRECVRGGHEPGSHEWNIAFGLHLDKITKRNNADKNRDLDPVVPDQDMIEYWTSQDLMDGTVSSYAYYLYDGDYVTAVQALFAPDRDYTDVPRIGAGLKAVHEGRQIHFDTTPFATYDNSKHAMLLAANTMFEEALRAQRLKKRD